MDPHARASEVLNWSAVKPSVLIPITLILIGLLVLWTLYRRKLADLAPDAEARSMPGARLSADRLQHLTSPPWRVVYEVGGKLGDIDQVVIGPTGVIAIETVVGDRPQHSGGPSTDPQRVANAALARVAVDELTQRVGVRCQLHAKVFWGVPQPTQPAGIEVATGQVNVEGQRLEEWLISQPPGPLSASQVDQVWQTIVVGIGRPDPLTPSG